MIWKRLQTISLGTHRTTQRHWFAKYARQHARFRAVAERGRMVPEFRESAIRQLLVGRYRLIYQVSKDTVDILALVHAARDLPALWERQDRETR